MTTRREKNAPFLFVNLSINRAFRAMTSNTTPYRVHSRLDVRNGRWAHTCKSIEVEAVSNTRVLAVCPHMYQANVSNVSSRESHEQWQPDASFTSGKREHDEFLNAEHGSIIQQSGPLSAKRRQGPTLKQSHEPRKSTQPFRQAL